jgi:nicotinamide mononucleotide adenylyltransferase
MLKGESWEELVPKSVAIFIKEIDGINRLRDLTKSDRV